MKVYVLVQTLAFWPHDMVAVKAVYSSLEAVKDEYGSFHLVPNIRGKLVWKVSEDLFLEEHVVKNEAEV
jgi:hypothetical protein